MSFIAVYWYVKDDYFVLSLSELEKTPKPKHHIAWTVSSGRQNKIPLDGIALRLKGSSVQLVEQRLISSHSPKTMLFW